MKLKLRIIGDRVLCGRDGCGEPLGQTATSPGARPVRRVYLSGDLWHVRTLDDGSRQWERAGRERRPWPAPLGELREWRPERGDIVVCPRPTCKARQRVPAIALTPPRPQA
jgi:hypothetical protein